MAYMGLEKQHKNKYQSKAFFLIQIDMGKLLILISPNQDIVSFHVREKKGGFNLEFQLFSYWFTF